MAGNGVECQVPEPLSEDEARRVLTRSEIEIIEDSSDLGYIARIKLMSSDELSACDHWGPKKGYLKHYMTLQGQWLRLECYLLGRELGREPTVKELFADAEKNDLSHRFRAFYVMKYPENVDWSEAA